MNRSQFDYHQETGCRCTEEADDTVFKIFTEEYVEWLEEKYGELNDFKEQIRNLLKTVKV